MTVVVSELSDYPPGDMCSRAAMSQLKSVSYASGSPHVSVISVLLSVSAFPYFPLGVSWVSQLRKALLQLTC